MPKADATIELLTEIRDLQREQVALHQAHHNILDRDRKVTSAMSIVKMVIYIGIVIFVMGAFYYFYATVGSIADSAMQ